MGSDNGKSPLQVVTALAALLALAALAFLILPQDELRCTAVVDASRSFSLNAVAPGQLEWSLRDGSTPGGQGLIQQRIVFFERSDTVDFRLAPGLTNGLTVEAGSIVATVSSSITERRLAELAAEHSALVAERALLVAGGTPEARDEAQRTVDLAEGRRAATSAELERMRTLAEAGLASDQELEIAELLDEVEGLRIVLARAGVEVTNNRARPEALSEIDSRLVGLEAGLEHARIRRHQEAVTCPISGIVNLGPQASELRVHALDPVFLEIPIPAASRSRVTVGAVVLFTTTVIPDTPFEGVLEQIADSPTNLEGSAVFWATARVSNPDHRLRYAMTGSAVLPLDSKAFGRLASFRQRMWELFT